MKWFWGFLAAFALLAAPAAADFTISKPTAAKPAKRPTEPAPAPAPRRPRVERTQAAPPPRPAPPPPGFDPALLQEAILAAGYTSSSMTVAADGGPKIDVKSGKSGWTAEFSDCANANRCKSVNFFFVWEIANDANICAVWGHYITQDEDGAKGLPMCTVVPPSGKMLRLSLSSTQLPYAGIDRAPADEKRSILANMVKTWASYSGRLTEARDIANKKCPRGRPGCWPANEPTRSNLAPQPASDTNRRVRGGYR